MNLKALVKGYIGEKINSILLQQLPVNEYHIINNLILRLPDGSTTQIDHVIVSAYGIFVIETKNYKGKIYGTERAGQWTQYLGQKSYPFMNPLHQNYKHVMALRQMTGLEKDCFISIVAFSDEAKLKIHTTSHVVTFGEIVRTIRSYRVLKIAPDMVAYYTEWIKKSNNSGIVNQIRHVHHINTELAKKETQPKETSYKQKRTPYSSPMSKEEKIEKELWEIKKELGML